MIDGAKPRTLDPASVEVHPRGTRVKLEGLESRVEALTNALDVVLWLTTQGVTPDVVYQINQIASTALDTGPELDLPFARS